MWVLCSTECLVDIVIVVVVVVVAAAIVVVMNNFRVKEIDFQLLNAAKTVTILCC